MLHALLHEDTLFHPTAPQNYGGYGTLPKNGPERYSHFEMRWPWQCGSALMRAKHLNPNTKRSWPHPQKEASYKKGYIGMRQAICALARIATSLRAVL